MYNQPGVTDCIIVLRRILCFIFAQQKKSHVCHRSKGEGGESQGTHASHPWVAFSDPGKQTEHFLLCTDMKAESQKNVTW